MATSGTYSWNLSLSELLIDAYERCGKNFATLEQEAVRSGVRSLNFVLVSWANRGINLWTVAEYSVYMPRGVINYTVLPQVVDVLADSVILRQYQMGAPTSVTPAFTTTINTPTVTVSGFTTTPIAGQYINVGVMTSVGGLVIDGFYQVVSVPGSGQANIAASANATASVTSGGAVPSFSSTSGSTAMAVAFANHGLLAGQTFVVEVQTTVGGVNLSGPYAVATVTDANNFTFTAPYPAGSTATVGENGGLTALATPTALVGSQSANPTDIQMYPLSRTDYYVIPNKETQGRPTSYWVNRQISPVFFIWPAPDGNGPYELRYMASQQVQDASIANGEFLQVPYRLVESFCADVAAHLSMKVAPERQKDLSAYALERWTEASDEDRERTSTFMVPDLSGYNE